jgi:hypothetical protein
MVVASEEVHMALNLEIHQKVEEEKVHLNLDPSIHSVVQDFDQMEEVEWKIDEELELVVEFV